MCPQELIDTQNFECDSELHTYIYTKPCVEKGLKLILKVNIPTLHLLSMY